jgi:hypothetical protein
MPSKLLSILLSFGRRSHIEDTQMPFRSIGRRLIAGLICLICVSLHGLAQVPNPTKAKPDQPLLTTNELDALVAPVALYPDTLLAELLMASTYPLEVVQADRWLRGNKQLEDAALKGEADKQPWESSVKSLVGTPAVLEMMSRQLDWTEKLGNAVLAQQADVMAAIQRLRLKAYDNRKLTSTKEQAVSVSQADERRLVTIAPATANVISVPYYNPAIVYAPWPYPEDDPYYFGTPDYIPAGLVASGVAFGAGYLLGRWTTGGNYWGGGISWDKGDINIDRPIRGDHVSHWQHNTGHRRGVRYTHANVRQKFASIDNRAVRDGRDNLRANAGTSLRSGAVRAGVAGGARGDRKQAAAKGGKKAAAKRTGPSKTASSKARSPDGRQKQASANPRAGRGASVQRRPAHMRVSRPAPRYAGFSGRGGGRGFGGGGRSFGGGGFRGGRR